MAVLPAVVLFYAALMPNELRLVLADQYLYAPRMISFLLIPWIVWQVIKREVKLHFWDFLFVAATFWMVYSFMNYYEPAEGLLRGGALALDAVLPFLIARFSIRSPDDFRRFLVLVAPAIFLVGLMMLAEVAAGRAIIRPAFASVFGDLSAYLDGVAVGRARDFVDYRFGFFRAAGPFSHPILAGFVLASFLPIYWFAGLRKWPTPVGVLASVFAILSFSSAVILALILAIGLMVADYIQRMVAFLSWKIITFVAVMTAATLHFASENGLVSVLVRLTLNPSTGRFRTLIWEYGLISVQNHPWFGIGFTNYERLEWMVPSVDAHWLLLGIRHGWIPPVLMLLTCIAAIFLLAMSASRSGRTDRRLRVGMAISLFVCMMTGFTVSFFGGAATWVYMLLGMSLSVGVAPIMQHRLLAPGAPVRPTGRLQDRPLQPIRPRSRRNAPLGPQR
ncbi:MAG: O-antigen ligase family protein [Pseudomonadota bacterium]